MKGFVPNKKYRAIEFGDAEAFCKIDLPESTCLYNLSSCTSGFSLSFWMDKNFPLIHEEVILSNGGSENHIGLMIKG